MKIALIACSATKLPASVMNPKQLFPAQNLYTSQKSFIPSVAFCTDPANGFDDWHILSAKYALLDKNTLICYYDLCLTKQTPQYKKMWAEEILEKLQEKYDLKNDEFHIFGPKSYYENLIPYLNSVVYDYNGYNINLAAPVFYKNGTNMIQAKKLRTPAVMQKVPDCPGYYKWWAKKEELDTVLKALGVKFSDVSASLEKKGDYFCLYVGIAAQSLRKRVNWHLNDTHTVQRVNSKVLSTLRQTVSSLIAKNQYFKKATDDFLDKLCFEWFPLDTEVPTDETKGELHGIERKIMSEHFYPLNIQDNGHPLAKDVTKTLSDLRNKARFEVTDEKADEKTDKKMADEAPYPRVQERTCVISGGKYGPLGTFLLSEKKKGNTVISKTFLEIEAIIKAKLPATARNNEVWWANDETHVQAKDGWLAAGFVKVKVDLQGQTVDFVFRG